MGSVRCVVLVELITHVVGTYVVWKVFGPVGAEDGFACFFKHT